MIGGGFYPYTYGYPYPYYGYSYPYYGYGYPPTSGYPPTYSYPPTYTPGSTPAYPSYPPPGYQGNQGYGDGDYGPPPDVQAPPPSSQSAPSEPDVEVPPTGQYGAALESGAASNYGFVQFREVPSGASVDLDQRPWVRSPGLENHWLAIPAGAHTITVRAAGYAPTERRIDVAGGRQQIVRVGSLRALTDYRDD